MNIYPIKKCCKVYNRVKTPGVDSYRQLKILTEYLQYIKKKPILYANENCNSAVEYT
jgi:hypothetical protein